MVTMKTVIPALDEGNVCPACPKVWHIASVIFIKYIQHAYYPINHLTIAKYIM